MKKTQSIIKQESAGTLKRNIQMKEEYKPGLGAKIGRAQNPPISRQAVHVIVNRKDLTNYYQTHHLSFWGVFWGKLMSYLLGR